MNDRTLLPSRALPRGILILPLLFLFVSCAGDTSDKPVPLAPRGVPTPVESASTATTDQIGQRIEDANRLGRTLAAIFQTARSRVNAVEGSARYWGDNLDRIEIAVSFTANAKGFDDFKYAIDCSGPQPRPICGMIRAYDRAAIEEVTAQVRALLPGAAVEMHVVGKADSAWSSTRAPRTYGGECGEGECVVDQGTLRLERGMKVDSNEGLACLRALCSFSQSGLEGVIAPKLSAQIVGKAGVSTARRAEMALFMSLPTDNRTIIWDSFLRAVGHK